MPSIRNDNPRLRLLARLAVTFAVGCLPAALAAQDNSKDVEATGLNPRRPRSRRGWTHTWSSPDGSGSMPLRRSDSRGIAPR